MTIEHAIDVMQKFMLDEPSKGYLVNGNEVTYTNFDLERMAEFANEFDETNELTLVYLAAVCRWQIEHTTCPVADVLKPNRHVEKYRKCLECATSDLVEETRSTLAKKAALVLGSASGKKMLGDEKAVYDILDDAIGTLFDEFHKLKFEVYSRSGLPVGALATTSLSVQRCGSLAELLMRLEKSRDGIYIGYVSIPGTPDGWFGFFVKSNGNMFSYNERVDEEYVGQNGMHRNGRYAERAHAYGLFPYELCEFSEERDYKGYAKSCELGDDTSIVGDGVPPEVALRTFLAMGVIAQKHGSRKVEGEPVLVDSMLPQNLALLDGTADGALVKWSESPLVEAMSKAAAPEFDVGKLLRGDYDAEFDEDGYFRGVNQDMVDAYGAGFVPDRKKIFVSDSSRRLLGDAEVHQEFVGDSKRFRLRAYQETRRQLAWHIWKQMKAEYDAFGGKDGLMKWYRETLLAKKDLILSYCADAMSRIEGKEGSAEYGKYYRQKLKRPQGNETLFANDDRKWSILKNNHDMFSDIRLIDGHWKESKSFLSENKAKVFFKFNFLNSEQVADFLGCDLPKFCTGWHENLPYNGNSILDVTDPVGEIESPLHKDHVGFDFVVGFTAGEAKALCKDNKESAKRGKKK